MCERKEQKIDSMEQYKKVRKRNCIGIYVYYKYQRIHIYDLAKQKHDGFVAIKFSTMIKQPMIDIDKINRCG